MIYNKIKHNLIFAVFFTCFVRIFFFLIRITHSNYPKLRIDGLEVGAAE
jgi:hypothetical protein